MATDKKKKVKRCGCGKTSINSGCATCSKYKLKVMLSVHGRQFKVYDPQEGKKVGPRFWNFVNMNNKPPGEVMDYMTKNLIDTAPFAPYVNVLLLCENVGSYGPLVLKRKYN